MSESRVLLAVVTGAHGVSGRVRLKTFTDDPRAVGGYGPLTDEAGAETYRLRVTGSTKGGVIAEIDGLRKREAAEAMKGQGLYVERTALPASDDEEEFYHADLIGLAAETPEGQRLGLVRAIHDFGAGDVLDIKPSKGQALMVPFTREAVPEIDLEAGRLIVELPEEVEIHDTGEGGEVAET